MRAQEFVNSQRLKEQGVAAGFQVNEGLGDWITKKIDDYLGPSSVSSDDISRHMKAAPLNLPDDVAKQLTDAFLKKAETQRLLQQAAEAQKTTVQKIVPYLTYVARMFVSRWKQIPQADRQNALRNLAHNLMRFLLFVLETLAKSMVKKEDVAEEFVSEYRAAGKVSVAGTIKLGNQFKDTYEVVNTPISHMYEVRIDDSPRESYPSYYFYNKDTGACVGSFSINAMPDAADDASPIVRPGVQIVQPHMTLAPEVQGKGLGSLIYDTFLAGGNWLFATFDHSSGAGALWDRMATKGSNISVLYNFNSDTVVEPGTKQAQTAVRILGPKERFKSKILASETG